MSNRSKGALDVTTPEGLEYLPRYAANQDAAMAMGLKNPVYPPSNFAASRGRFSGQRKMVISTPDGKRVQTRVPFAEFRNMVDNDGNIKQVIVRDNRVNPYDRDKIEDGPDVRVQRVESTLAAKIRKGFLLLDYDNGQPDFKALAKEVVARREKAAEARRIWKERVDPQANQFKSMADLLKSGIIEAIKESRGQSSKSAK